MSELKYSKDYSTWLTAAGITPASTPISLRRRRPPDPPEPRRKLGPGTVTSVSKS